MAIGMFTMYTDVPFPESKRDKAMKNIRDMAFRDKLEKLRIPKFPLNEDDFTKPVREALRRISKDSLKLVVLFPLASPKCIVLFRGFYKIFDTLSDAIYAVETHESA